MEMRGLRRAAAKVYGLRIRGLKGWQIYFFRRKRTFPLPHKMPLEVSRKNMTKKSKKINWQNLRETNGNSRSYENYVLRSRTSNGEPVEHSRANPDRLTESGDLWGHREMTRAQELMGEAVRHLQGRQKEVYWLTMRDGKSLSEVGKILNISKDTARDYKERAIKFIKAYCTTILKKKHPSHD